MYIRLFFSLFRRLVAVLFFQLPQQPIRRVRLRFLDALTFAFRLFAHGSRRAFEDGGVVLPRLDGAAVFRGLFPSLLQPFLQCALVVFYHLFRG